MHDGIKGGFGPLGTEKQCFLSARSRRWVRVLTAVFFKADNSFVVDEVLLTPLLTLSLIIVKVIGFILEKLEIR